VQYQTNVVLVVGFAGVGGMLVDTTGGKIISTFTYGPPSTYEEAVARKERFGLKYEGDDLDFGFWAYLVAVSSEKGLVAAGSFHDQRVRVVKLTPPYPMLLEFNEEKNPFIPKGGVWMVDELSFQAKGQYLVVQYLFGGRGTRKVLRPKEIYETEGWKKVWETDDATIQAVTLSPDGTKMAYLQKDVLKIALFKARE
ncbi:MAG: hypothetical protein ACUVWX_11380, partial [Kiritimatiellia bacterium]